MSVLDNIFARYYDTLSAGVERRGLGELRRQLLEGLSGDVLEIGAGTGVNLAHYPTVLRSLTLTEPSPPMAVRLREHAARERPDAEVVDAPAEALPFDDASFDAVVTTLVLCSVDDPPAAVAELRRVLRPDGQLVVIEHVAAQGGASLGQKVWNPAQKVFGRNCHVTRDTRRTLEDGGFETGGIVDKVMPGAPAALFPAIAGIARLQS